VIVEFLLPEGRFRSGHRCARSLRALLGGRFSFWRLRWEFRLRFLLERLGEFQEIAAFLKAQRKYVNVIWHYAVGVNGKATGRGFAPQNLYDSIGPRSIFEQPPSFFTTNRDEAGDATDVARAMQAYVFVREVSFRHRGEC